MDAQLDLMDHGSFLGLQALGRQPLFVMTWHYDQPVDTAELERFATHLNRGMLGRLVQPSPVFGGRPRWVRAERPVTLDVEPVARPRSEVDAWADELSAGPLDLVKGPGWRLGVLSLSDGGSAVALVIPHLLGDGMCKTSAILDAINGVDSELAERAAEPRRRRGWRFAARELADVVRAVPEAPRALVAAFRVFRERREQLPPGRRVDQPSPAADPRSATGSYLPPEAVLFVDAHEWDECAARLAGTSNSLFAGVTAALAARLGRTLEDGRVALTLPVSQRREDDTRANALDSVTIAVDPQRVTGDLSQVRSATREALRELAGSTGTQNDVLPLVRWIPSWLVSLAEKLVVSAGISPVGCSNLGQLDPAIARVAGTPAARVSFRVREHYTSAAEVDRLGGQLFLSSGRLQNRVQVGVVAHVPGGPDDDGGLLDVLARTLEEFGLQGERA